MPFRQFANRLNFRGFFHLICTEFCFYIDLGIYSKHFVSSLSLKVSNRRKNHPKSIQVVFLKIDHTGCFLPIHSSSHLHTKYPYTDTTVQVRLCNTVRVPDASRPNPAAYPARRRRLLLTDTASRHWPCESALYY